MSTIDIYDIAKDKWYQQPTIAGPAQLTQGCAVVAVAQDYSSYNIYYYGGYNGIDTSGDYNDDVWILSLPSFMWMKVASGNGPHARAGHKCIKPYPDQMVVIGGMKPLRGRGGPDCVKDSIMLNFNLTDGQWLDEYNPDNWSPYGVPQMIHLMIGGDYSGGATMTTPTPTGWADPDLASVFATPYETSKLTTYYPYAAQDDDGNPRGTNSGGGGLPSWAAPVIGSILGLVIIVSIIAGVFLYRRRRFLKRNGGGTGGSQTEDNRVISWIRGQGNDKAGTVTSEDTSPGHHDDMESRLQGIQLRQPDTAYTTYHHEMEANSNSLPVEMPGKHLSR